MGDDPLNMPAELSWESAPGRILREAERLGAGGRVVVVGITGPVGAGKSTLARRVSGAVISTDSYLPDYELVPEHERDLPERADHGLLLKNLSELRAGRESRVPVWSFLSHRREGEMLFAPAPLIVVEGIHALHGPVAAAMDLRVFVDGSASVRWARWDVLERSGVRGWGPEKARAFFDNVAEPTFNRLAPAYRASAHLIVRNDTGVPRIEDLRGG
jgi:uridine kinase